MGPELKPGSMVAGAMGLTMTLYASYSFHTLQALRRLGGAMVGVGVIQGLLVIPIQTVLFLPV